MMRVDFLILVFVSLLVVASAERSTRRRTTARTTTAIKHPHGSPKRIIFFSDDVPVSVDLSAIEIFRHPEIKNRKIVAFSVVGVYRKGKSFYLNYCLRYLYGNYRSINYPDNPLSNKANWIGSDEEPLIGFPWKAGSNTHTKGILMWSDVFLHDAENGEKLAIVLIDTQGLFDNKASPEQSMRIFALNSLFASFFMLNLSGVMQQDQLEYLQMATSYGKLIYEISGTSVTGKPFQNILFLLRDWTNEHEYPFGLKGGTAYVKNFLTYDEDDEEQSERLREIREYIVDTYEKIYGYLLPTPGDNATTSSYDGSWGVLKTTFVEMLKENLNWMMSPKNLKIKHIFGVELLGETYYSYMKAFTEAFQSPELPNSQSLFQVTLEQQMKSISDECVNEYSELMLPFQDYRSENFVEIFESKHQDLKAKAIEKFMQRKKIGNRNHEESFKNKLEGEIEKIYENQKQKLMQEFEKYQDQQRQHNHTIDRIQQENRQQITNLNEQMQRERIELERNQENLRLDLQNEKLRSNDLQEQQHEQNHTIERIQKENNIKLLNITLQTKLDLEKQQRQHNAEMVRIEQETRNDLIKLQNEFENKRKLESNGIWVEWNTNKGNAPENAVYLTSGYYVVKLLFDGAVKFGKYKPSEYSAYYILNDNKIKHQGEIQVLTHTNYNWKKYDGSFSSYIPFRFLDGNESFLCRRKYGGTYNIGELSEKTKFCYVFSPLQEIFFRSNPLIDANSLLDFEVLYRTS